MYLGSFGKWEGQLIILDENFTRLKEGGRTGKGESE